MLDPAVRVKPRSQVKTGFPGLAAWMSCTA